MTNEDKIAIKELYHILRQKNDPQTLPYLSILEQLTGEKLNSNLKEDANLTEDANFESLQELLMSDEWPEAIEKNLICDQDSEIDKIGRAESILELLVEKDLKEKRFLDLGCGEGHVAYKALLQEPIVSVGYDILESPTWTKFGNQNKLFFTTNWQEVQDQSPYDVILIYDVIDHVEKEEAAKILNNAGQVLDKDGTIYLRAHPFCSRHATHLYHQINKAFIHLVFTPDELQKMGYEGMFHSGTIYPIKEYEALFKSSGLTISHNNILREKIEPFFKKNEAIKERIRKNYKNTSDRLIKSGGFPDFQCEQQFLDYVIKRTTND